MTFETFDAVLFTAAFLVPGFVWSAVLSGLLPRRTRAPDLRFLEFLTLSCVNSGLWSWALYLIFKTDFNSNYPVWTAGFVFAIIFVSPIGLGLLSGKLLQNNTVGRFLGRFGFRTISTIPTAWDWHFSRSKPYWTLVRLKDGSRVYGLFGLRSFAGDDSDERDLYLEVQFRPTDTGDWAPV